ncbi:hypothetical protein Esti_002740 [Eimeria stiedai]
MGARGTRGSSTPFQDPVELLMTKKQAITTLKGNCREQSPRYREQSHLLRLEISRLPLSCCLEPSQQAVLALDESHVDAISARILKHIKIPVCFGSPIHRYPCSLLSSTTERALFERDVFFAVCSSIASLTSSFPMCSPRTKRRIFPDPDLKDRIEFLRTSASDTHVSSSLETHAMKPCNSAFFRTAASGSWAPEKPSGPIALDNWCKTSLNWQRSRAERQRDCEALRERHVQQQLPIVEGLMWETPNRQRAQATRFKGVNTPICRHRFDPTPLAKFDTLTHEMHGLSEAHPVSAVVKTEGAVCENQDCPLDPRVFPHASGGPPRRRARGAGQCHLPASKQITIDEVFFLCQMQAASLLAGRWSVSACTSCLSPTTQPVERSTDAGSLAPTFKIAKTRNGKPTRVHAVTKKLCRKAKRTDANASHMAYGVFSAISIIEHAKDLVAEVERSLIPDVHSIPKADVTRSGSFPRELTGFYLF